MWPYWILFIIPAIAALASPGSKWFQVRGLSPGYLHVGWFAALISLIIMVGFRYQVGGDWVNYFHFLYDVNGKSFVEVMQMTDPSYMLANWLSVQFDFSTIGVNVLCSILFSIGLIEFCRNLPRPWLGLTVAVPYTVIVVGMGYTRQGVAIGLAMLGFLALKRNSTFLFVFWVVIAATFHKTAVLLLPIAVLSNTKSRFQTAIWIAVTFAVAYTLLLQESVDGLVQNYAQAQYQSEGALVRLLMNAFPAIILLWNSRKFNFSNSELSLWWWMAIISLVLLVAVSISPSSTAVDRIALYMLPLQLVVFANCPEALKSKAIDQNFWVLIIIFYYACVLFVWLNFADNSLYWVPYKSFLFQ